LEKKSFEPNNHEYYLVVLEKAGLGRSGEREKHPIPNFSAITSFFLIARRRSILRWGKPPEIFVPKPV
jgi:hypothetical protein